MMPGRGLRRRWTLALAAGLAAGLIAAPASAAVPHQPVHAIEPALWVIRDADSTVYLFGTVHLLRATTVWESTRVMAAFDASTEVWFEVDAMAEATTVPALVAAYGMSSRRPLSERLSPGDRRALSAAAGRAGLTDDQFEAFQPWLAGLMVGNTPLLEAGYNAASGVESRLREQAMASGKPVRGLETMEDQFRYLAALPEDTQIDLLRYMTRSPQTVVPELDASVAAWASGDMSGVEVAMVQPMRRGSEALYQAMLAQRSLLLVNHLKRVLDGSGVAFVALGAGYLVGADSVLEALSESGVHVEAVP